MSKIDLIIDCMEQILNDELPSPENMMKAFRYACELKALKPVAMVDHSHPFSDDSVYMIANYERSFPSGTKLYALDLEERP